MNVDKMRRSAERSREDAQAREWAEWIASHDHTAPGCSVCMRRALGPLNRLARSMTKAPR